MSRQTDRSLGREAPHFPHSFAFMFEFKCIQARSINKCVNACVNAQAGRVSAEIPLDADVNRTGDVWHVMVPGLVPGLLYGEGREGGTRWLCGCYTLSGGGGCSHGGGGYPGLSGIGSTIVSVILCGLSGSTHPSCAGCPSSYCTHLSSQLTLTFPHFQATECPGTTRTAPRQYKRYKRHLTGAWRRRRRHRAPLSSGTATTR